MNIVGAVTAGAAGLAAILAGINLYVSGRRELHKWTREALVEALVIFLDTSLKLTSACGDLASGTRPPTVAERDRLRMAVVTAHDLETETVTRLRLLAPPQAVAAAEGLHEAEHELVDTCLPGGDPRSENLEAALVPVRRARAQFLEAARASLRLRDPAAFGHRHRDTWREFRAIAKAGAGQDSH